MKSGLLRVPLFLLVMGALLAALWGGLLRLGWRLPALQPGLVLVHGPLMISGVLGSLIALERAVALGSLGAMPRAAYMVPALSGVGALVLVLGLPPALGLWSIAATSAGFVMLTAYMAHLQRATYTRFMAVGALAWLAGNLLWLAGHPVYRAVPWWVSFLLLTIVAERLELARITQLSARAGKLFLLAAAVFLLGVALTLIDHTTGVRLAGIGELGLAVWLLRYDIARHSLRRPELPRFIAVCLLIGYLWLGISGVLRLAFGSVQAGLHYDAQLHSFFLGFVFSMIFGHAPIIFPALTRREIIFRSAFYLPLALLHLSLVVRLLGDLGNWLPGRQWGGLFNVITILLFMVTMGYSVFRGRKTS